MTRILIALAIGTSFVIPQEQIRFVAFDVIVDPAGKPLAAWQTVEKALAVAGGQGYFRGMGLERRFRDIQAARYHPIQEPKQHRFSGRIALGLDPVA